MRACLDRHAGRGTGSPPTRTSNPPSTWIRTGVGVCCSVTGRPSRPTTPSRWSSRAASRARERATPSEPGSLPSSSSTLAAADAAPPSLQMDSALPSASRWLAGSSLATPTSSSASARRSKACTELAASAARRAILAASSRAPRPRATQPTATRASGSSVGVASSSASAAVAAAASASRCTWSLASPARAGTSTWSSPDLRARPMASSYAAPACSSCPSWRWISAIPYRPDAVRPGPRRRLCPTARWSCHLASSYSPVKLERLTEVVQGGREPAGRGRHLGQPQRLARGDDGLGVAGSGQQQVRPVDQHQGSGHDVAGPDRCAQCLLEVCLLARAGGGPRRGKVGSGERLRVADGLGDPQRLGRQRVRLVAPAEHREELDPAGAPLHTDEIGRHGVRVDTVECLEGGDEVTLGVQGCRQQRREVRLARRAVGSLHERTRERGGPRHRHRAGGVRPRGYAGRRA